jgi:hypothetical protein
MDLSTDASASQRSATDNVTPIRFVRIAVELLPLLYALGWLHFRVYAELVSRCDGWERRKLRPPFVRAAAVAASIGSTERRVQLAIGELCRRRFIERVGDPHNSMGCQYRISDPDILLSTPIPQDRSETLHSDPPGSEWDTFTPIPQDRSDPPHTLLRSRSIDHCQPRSRAGARGAGGQAGADDRPENNFGDSDAELVLLFDPRWQRHGAKLIRRKLSELRASAPSATTEQIARFVRKQLRDDSVQKAQCPPVVALCPESFSRFLASERRAAKELAADVVSERKAVRPPKPAAATLANVRAALGLRGAK